MPRRAGMSFVSLLLASFLAVACAFGHDNEKGKTEATIGKAKVSIEYGRPMLKGRDINKMIRPGQMWRIGADIPTVIESDGDLNFGDTRVPKGKHVLLARLVTPGQWSLVVSTQAINHYEPSSKLAEIPLKLEQEKDPVNELTIRLSNDGGRGVIEISWGTARLLASFEPAS